MHFNVFKVFLVIFITICSGKENSTLKNNTSQQHLSKDVKLTNLDHKFDNNHVRPDAILATNKDQTHKSREGVTDIKSQIKITSNDTTRSKHIGQPIKMVSNSTHTEDKHNSSKYDVVMAEKNDGTQVVGRKGVVFNKTVGLVKEKPKKPQFTEAADNEPVSNDSVVNVAPDQPGLQYVTDGKKSINFVVPIVAVILSVPLVAILISVFFKRSSEWWHHRHYRRMDFLIEGMYNN